MNDPIFPRQNSKRGTFWAIVLFAPALLWAGCATPPEPSVTPAELESVKQRVQDVERTNGRLMVRVEEMERQHNLVQDRVESNRIALQRRGYLRQQGGGFARAPSAPNSDSQRRPDPAPESNYRQQDRSGNYQADPSMQQRKDRRGMARIPLPDQDARDAGAESSDRYVEFEAEQSAAYDDDDGETLVLTNEILEQRYGSGSSSSNRSSSSESPRQEQRSGSAHAPVTSERLPTTAELDSEQRSQEQQQQQQENQEDLSEGELLDLYQDALAKYRAGEYADALQSFTRFLEAGPRADYVDNAMYWIGECHYGLGQYDTSVDHFQRILDELPSADKVPDAMLKMSLAYDRLGQPERAFQLLEELTEKYPESNPGRLGSERIDEHPLGGQN